MTSSNETLATEPQINGHVDSFTDTVVSGWVFDAGDPLRRCSVKLVHDGRTVARAIASDFRADLKTAGIGDGAYAFALLMPRAFLDGEEYTLQVVEEVSGAPVGPARLWRSSVGTSAAGLFSGGFAKPAASGKKGAGPVLAAKTTILIDLSDLIYYIGHHDNLTGIQRVQSSIVLAMARGEALAGAPVAFITYYNAKRTWMVVPFAFLINLLEDLLYPKKLRRVQFSAAEARSGLLPGSVELERSGAINPSAPSVLCLLGAAWVQRDYFNRVLALKRKYSTKFVMLVHDLIPIYARDTCDQGTAQAFEAFFVRAMRHVDHYLCVSENTARDLRAYLSVARAAVPPITVTRLGSSFTEFITLPTASQVDALDNVPDRFVLFVSTIEGRKNHRLVFDVWRRLVERGEDPPVLLCVGRLGWKAQPFLSGLVETAYLGGRIMLLEDISDEQLRTLYERCLFTVFPSLYEGWGLPVGESLASGRICVCSMRASIPEVAGEFGVFIDIEDLEGCVETIGRLARDEAMRKELEERIQRDYEPVSWDTVAAIVVHTCEEAAKIKWPEPYPFAALPYSSEIGFSIVAPTIEGVFGEKLLSAISSPRKPYILFDPLVEASILLGEEVRASGEWCEPEIWGTWMCEAGGEIVVALSPNDSCYYYLFLRLRASRPLAQSPIRLLVNGELLWDDVLGENSRTVVIRVVKKSGDKAAGWRLRIRAELDLNDDLHMQLALADSRVPTIGFERMAVIPESDVNARLEASARL